MAVAFSAVVSVTPGTGSNTGASPSITAPATNPVILVGIAIKHASATVSSLTITGFGGTATEVKAQRSTGAAPDAYTSVWRIVAPTANTSGTVQANFSTSVPYQMAVSAFSGADQTDPVPIGDAKSSATSTTPTTLTPTNLVSGDATFGAEAQTTVGNCNAITPNNRFLDNSTAINCGVGDATNTTGCTFGQDSGNEYSCVAVRIAQFSGAAVVKPTVLRPYQAARGFLPF